MFAFGTLEQKNSYGQPYKEGFHLIADIVNFVIPHPVGSFYSMSL